MEEKKADSPIADTILLVKERAKNVVGSSTNSKSPNRMWKVPAKMVPNKNSRLDPIAPKYLPKIGQNTKLVINMELNTYVNACFYIKVLRSPHCFGLTNPDCHTVIPFSVASLV